MELSDAKSHDDHELHYPKIANDLIDEEMAFYCTGHTAYAQIKQPANNSHTIFGFMLFAAIIFLRYDREHEKRYKKENSFCFFKLVILAFICVFICVYIYTR